MANDQIKKADNGTYYFRANLGFDHSTGKRIQKYRSGFKTKKEAKEEYAKLVLQFASQSLPTEQKRIPFGTFIEDTYLPWYQTQVKESTFENRAGTVRKHFSCFYEKFTDAIGFNWERQKRIKPTLDSRLAELWDEEKNGAVELVRLKQRDRYWWKCPICGCEWSRELGAALKSNLCPACNGRVLVKGYNDLATTHPELAAEWDYDRNGELRPSDVLAGSTRAVWWKCSKCHGVWQCKVVNRKLNAVRCPYCRKKRLLKGFNDLASQYPELAKEYLPELNSGITADELPIRNNTKVKWRCCKCGYEWITTIGHRAKRGTGCPRCNDKKTSQSKMKAVVCVETGKIYESIMSAGRDVERTDGAICQALRNESRTCAGYHWKYLDE